MRFLYERIFWENLVEELNARFPYFFLHLVGEEDGEDSGDDWDDGLRWLQKIGIDIESGAEKTVFIADDHATVLKVPSALHSTCTLEELYIYRSARDLGLARYFAKADYGFTVKIGKNFIDAILMEKATFNPDEISENSEFGRECSTMREELDRDEYEDWYTENYWRKDSVEAVHEYLHKIFSENEVLKLENFLERYDVNDLHTSNCGWNSNGDFVFTDYSGYCVSRSVATGRFRVAEE